MIRAIAARILPQVLLVIVLGVVERRRLADFGGDLAVARLIQRLLIGNPRLLRSLQLAIVGGVDCGAVLSPDVVALAHPLGGIVRLPEHAQQLLITDALWVEDHLDRFRMAGGSGADLLIARIFRAAAGVADRGRIHPRQLPEGLLGAPEATHREQGAFQAVGKWRLDAMTIYKMRLGGLHGAILVLLTSLRLQSCRPNLNQPQQASHDERRLPSPQSAPPDQLCRQALWGTRQSSAGRPIPQAHGRGMAPHPLVHQRCRARRGAGRHEPQARILSHRRQAGAVVGEGGEPCGKPRSVAASAKSCGPGTGRTRWIRCRRSPPPDRRARYRYRLRRTAINPCAWSRS